MSSTEKKADLYRRIQGVFLPISFVASLLILLLLILKSHALSELTESLERGGAQRAQIVSEIAPLQERLLALRSEVSSTQAQLEGLLEQKRSSMDLIGQGRAETANLEQLRGNSTAALEDFKRQQKSFASQMEQIRASAAAAEEEGRRQQVILADGIERLRQDQEALQRGIEERRRLLREADAVLAQKEKEATLTQERVSGYRVQLVDLEAQIKDREATIRGLAEQIVDKERILAKRAGDLGVLDASAEALSESIAKHKAESESLSQQIATLKKIKGDLAGNERLRAEKAALTARIAVLQADAGELDAAIKEMARTHREQVSELADLKRQIDNLKQRRDGLNEPQK